MQECGEKREDGEYMNLRYRKHFRWVKVVPVTELMRFGK